MRFSVVIPCYNGEKHIHISVESVLAQSFEDFEIVVVDDGSKDATAEAVRSLAAKDQKGRVRLVERENGGVSAARNSGILASRGDYVCFLDSDDQWLPGHLAALSEAIERYPQEVFFSTLSQTRLVDGRINRLDKDMPEDIFVIEDYFDYEISAKPSVSKFTSTICLKRSFFDRHGLFVEGVKISEDEDMWYRAAAYHNFVVIPRITVQRNRDLSEATRRPVNPETDPFVQRKAQLLSDERISADKRRSIELLIERHEIRLIRSMIKNGHKKKALKTLLSSRFDARYRKTLLITWASLLIPMPIIRAMEMRNVDKSYYRG